MESLGKIAKEMADLENDDYKRLLCVEITNAANDVVKVSSGEECKLSANYRVMHGRKMIDVVTSYR